MYNLKIFESSQFGKIRTSVTESGEPLFCLVDVCRILGLTQPSRVKSTLRQDGVITIKGVSNTTNQYGTTTQQEVMMNFITEPNLYKCIFQSRKQEAEAFQDWVCGEVLPSIRKNGGYMVAKEDESPEEIMARALLLANDTLKRQRAQIKAAEHRFYGYSFVSSFDVNKSQNISEDIAMGNCIQAVIECDAIYLDHAWQSSKGCNLEYRAAKIYDKEIYEHDKL